MEKLDKVIAALERCVTAGGCIGCEYSDYSGSFDKCRERLVCDALDLLKSLDGKYRAALEAAATATELAAKKEKSLNQAWEKLDGLALKLAQTQEELSDLRKAASNDDLISRSALLTEIEENPWSIDVDELKVILEHVPTVEAEPVVHAHWIKRAGGTHNICSNCHSGVPSVVSVKGWQRCCICGAHMDEEVADE